VGTDASAFIGYLMPHIHIVSSKNFEQFKQRARRLKRSEGIPHHLALERVARSLKFENWHQITVAAAETSLSEAAHRAGLIIGLDVKDASEYRFDHDGTFIEDHRLWHFCAAELFQNYCLSTDDEGRTFESMSTAEELREEFEMGQAQDTVLYRYTGPTLPATVDNVFAMSRQRCFFAPVYVWFKGQFIDVFDHLSEDGMMVW
jgi:hypothetical protein